MTLNNHKKFAQHILRLLKVQEVIFPIARTSKGNFGLRFSSSSEDFEMYLDAVPLSTKDMLNDENNIELKKMIERYMFSEEQLLYKGVPIVKDEPINRVMIVPLPKRSFDRHIKNIETQEVVSDMVPIMAKKRGRPAGSKNKYVNDKTEKAS